MSRAKRPKPERCKRSETVTEGHWTSKGDSPYVGPYPGPCVLYGKWDSDFLKPEMQYSIVASPA